MQTLFFIYKHYGKYKWYILPLGIFGFISSLLGGIGIGAVIPLLSLLMDGRASSTDKVSVFIANLFTYVPFGFTIYSVLILIILSFLVRAVVLFIFGFFRNRLILDYKRRTLNELFRALLHARWDHLLSKKVGHMQNYFFRDVEKSTDLLDAISYIPFALINIMIFLGFALIISPQITALTFVFGVMTVGISRPLLYRLKRANTILAAQNKNVSHFLIEHFIGIKSIKAGAREDQVQERAENTFFTWCRVEFRSKILSFMNKNFFEPLSIIFVAGIIVISYSTPDFSIQSFAVTLLLVQRIFVYIQHAQNAFSGLIDALPYAKQVIEFKESLGASAEVVSGKKHFEFNRTLAFRNVFFSYTPDKKALSSVSFSIQKGNIVGLIGPSGAGKTSVVDLLLRLFDPDSGAVLLDDYDAREFHLQEWRSHFGYVAQDAFLLNDTIAQNIRFYNDALTQSEIIDAARHANIYDHIMSLKDGFDTKIGDRGIMVSGGQRQRIVLARTLAQKPSLLILDEATSALDNESENLIQKAIRDLKGKVTVVIIAHRLSTVVDVDHLLVLQNGKITEEGKPEDLLQKKDSYFYRMYHVKE